MCFSRLHLLLFSATLGNRVVSTAYNYFPRQCILDFGQLFNDQIHVLEPFYNHTISPRYSTLNLAAFNFSSFSLVLHLSCCDDWYEFISQGPTCPLFPIIQKFFHSSMMSSRFRLAFQTCGNFLLSSSWHQLYKSHSCKASSSSLIFSNTKVYRKAFLCATQTGSAVLLGAFPPNVILPWSA